MSRAPTHPARPTERHAGLIAAMALVMLTMALTLGIGLAHSPEVAEMFFGLGGVSAFTAVGVVILWQRPGHGIGRLTLAIGILWAALGAIETGLLVMDEGWVFAPVIRDVADFASESLGALALLGGAVITVVWFPDGRRTSRLGGFIEVLGGIGVAIVMLDFVSDWIVDVFGEGSILIQVLAATDGGFNLIVLAMPLAFIDIALRYRGADAVRRTQFRWVLAASATTAALLIGVITLGDVPGLWSLWILSTLLPPFAIVIAITRYRLYDIDRIISRTISYGLITALLVAVFLVVNLGLQSALSDVTSGNSLAVAGSTLLAAALFTPVRRRVQRIVDRRFDRARYDGERTVSAFSVRMRDATDLPTVAADLDVTVRPAIAPSSVGLWLRAGGR